MSEGGAHGHGDGGEPGEGGAHGRGDGSEPGEGGAIAREGVDSKENEGKKVESSEQQTQPSQQPQGENELEML